ncbi:hypothetical protein [Luteimonas aquatica]|uniref:hypothetical protein n=1 Tax=Luteimonas aquatica TaxID=450364 RepID=UPI001F570EE3|nr:hypothetical protein [Luteimonas aquatica]
MRNINHKYVIAILALIFGSTAGNVTAYEYRASESIPERAKKSRLFGMGVVRWVSIAHVVNGRAQLFTLMIDYGEKKQIKVCAEQAVAAGQRVFFVISNDKRNDNCVSGAAYIPAESYSQILYRGFEDLIEKKVWFEVPAGRAENFGCPEIETITAETNFKSKSGGRVDVSGFFSGEVFFSSSDMASCLVKNKLPAYR